MSSGFSDNFHRDEEKLLDYDDSAFYYFFISILTVGLIPLTYSIVKTMLFGEQKLDTSNHHRHCECSRCVALMQKR